METTNFQPSPSRQIRPLLTDRQKILTGEYVGDHTKYQI